jgi:hypothetical protein
MVLCLLALLAGCGTTAPSVKESRVSAEAERILNLIAAFREDTDNSLENIKKYGGIVDYAIQGQNTMITISPEQLPSESASESFGPLFLLAFIAGNLEYQLKTGVMENNPGAGMEFERVKYEQLRKANPKLHIAFFDR